VPRVSGASGVTSLSRPTCCGLFVPTCAVIVPSAAISTAAFAGSVIGPPSPSTGSPALVTSWPSASVCSAPARV